MASTYDSFLLVSFGGPEGPADVLPFLRNVLRGKNVPEARLLEVAEHYDHFGGVSPINGQNRELLAALGDEFADSGLNLPIYWGNRNWDPLLTDTIAQMAADGRQRAIAFFTSAYSCYSGCRQYRENIAAACSSVGPTAPQIDKLRMFYNHPGFIEPMVDSARGAFARLSETARGAAELIFTAHSIPLAMADGCNYQRQLNETARLIADRLEPACWQLVYQSRSGPPQQPWLEPDICDYIQKRHAEGLRAAIILPIGFVSDHMEVLYDLDTEARQLCDELSIEMVRANTVGTDSRFIRMIRLLVEERMTDEPERLALGSDGPSHDVCPEDCCLYTPTRPAVSR